MLRLILLCLTNFLATQVLASTTFSEDYATWINPENQFVIEVSPNELRPLYAYGDFSSNDDNTAPIGTGINPTVSEGLGYALLFAYAANDQDSFNKFLRFAWKAAYQYGCRGQANSDTPCEQRVNLVPWMLNENGEPFMTTGTGAMDGNASVYYSSGSASDADFQIAWAIHLAATNEHWQSNQPQDLNYADIFEAMKWDIAKFDINLDNNLYVPGASWFEEGENTYFPGYYTPQSFDIFAQHAQNKLSQKIKLPNGALSLTVNNSTSKTAMVYDDIIYTTGVWDLLPENVEPGEKSFTFTPDGTDRGHSVTVGWGQYDSVGATHLCTARFDFNHIYSTWAVYLEQLTQCELKKISEGVYTFNMYDTAIKDWLTVKHDNLTKIIQFQHQYSDGLIPNIADPNTLETKYNDHYGYDATRYPLWAGAYLLTQCNENNVNFCETLSSSLTQLTQFFINQGVIEAGSLPVDGYYYGPNMTSVSSDLAGPALNGPVLVAALALHQIELYEALLPRFNSYDLYQNKPDVNQPYNSSAYYEGALLMLSKAAMEGRL